MITQYEIKCPVCVGTDYYQYEDKHGFYCAPCNACHGAGYLSADRADELIEIAAQHIEKPTRKQAQVDAEMEIAQDREIDKGYMSQDF